MSLRFVRSAHRLAARLAGGWLVTLAAVSASPAMAGTAFRMPAPGIRTLANGLEVAVFSDPRLPMVQVLLLIPAGSAADPPGLAGTAHLTAQLLSHGTSSRTAAAFAAELDGLAGNVVAGATRDYSTVAGAFLARDLDAGLEIMSDAVVNPAFDAQEFEQLRSQILGNLARQHLSPANVAGEQIWAAVFGDHPYALPAFGTPGTLERLTPDALRAFYGAHYRPDRSMLAIAGDVTPDRALAAATEWFGRWGGVSAPAAGRPFTGAASGGLPGRLRIRLFDAPGLRETEIRLGLAMPPKGDPDETAVTLAGALLGGGPSSRLARLAAQGSLGREAWGLNVVLKNAGIFTMGVTIGSDSVRIAVERLRDELGRFAREPLDEAELASARRTLMNVMPMQFETLGALLNQWCTSRCYGLPEGNYDRQRERLETLAAAEVSTAASRWLDPGRLRVVAVGPAAEIRPQLEALGEVEVIGRGAPSTAVTPEPPPAAGPPARGQVTRGRAIVRKAVAAHGGLARLRGIKDSTVEADATLILGGRRLQGRMVQVRKEPYKMLLSTAVEGIDTEQTLNGSAAWSIASTAPEPKAQDMDSLGVAGMRAGFGSDLPHLLLGAADAASRVASLGKRRVGDREAEAVEVRAGPALRVLYFDPRTYRLVAMDQHEAGGGAAGFEARRIYGDLRPVRGILWPHSEERLLGGERVMEIKVTRVSLDSGVDDSIFEKPEPALPPPAR